MYLREKGSYCNASQWLIDRASVIGLGLGLGSRVTYVRIVHRAQYW